MSRATTAYASAYQRDRVHVCAFRQRERSVMTADFTALVPEGVSITSATWRTTNPWSAAMSDAGIDGGKVRMTADFRHAGCADLKVTVTLSDGSVHSQLFAVRVSGAPGFADEPWMPSGPDALTVTA